MCDAALLEYVMILMGYVGPDLILIKSRIVVI